MDFAAEAKIRKMTKMKIARMAFGSREIAVSTILLVLFQALVRSIPIDFQAMIDGRSCFDPQSSYWDSSAFRTRTDFRSRPRRLPLQVHQIPLLQSRSHR
jgi:hypothetical protein